jgi:hypothetical protein
VSGNERAPDGQVWVCQACGKRSRDLYGDEPLSYGWDESCILHAALLPEDRLVLKGSRVVEVLPERAS